MAVKARNITVTLILTAPLLCALWYITVFAYQYGWQWIDSEHSAEMVLGKLLADEHALLSANWYYSNEIRLVYQTIFTMPLFKLLGRYENWALIRSVNILFNNIVLIASYLFLTKSMRITAKWSLITSLFLLMPLSITYWDIVTFGGYYIFFIAQLFCCLGLCIRLVSREGVSNARRIDFVLFMLLSLVLGIQGIRALFAVSIPLCAACLYVWRGKKKRPLIYGGLGLAACCAGYMVNNFLHNIYRFRSYETMRLDNIAANLLSKLSQSLANIAGFFGYSAGNPVLSARGFFSAAAVIAAIIVMRVLYTAICQARRLSEPPLMPVFFAVSLAFNILVFVIVNQSIQARYFIPFMVLYVPLAAVFCEQDGKTYKPLKRVMVCAIMLCIFGQGCLNFHSLAARDINSNRKGYIQYLLNHRLKYGFATLMNANVTTELTSGAVEVAGLDPRIQSGVDSRPFKLYDYLNKVNYNDPYYYPGESFVLLTHDEWDSTGRRRAFAGGMPAYEDSHFVIIRYPSAQIIRQDLVDSAR